MRLWVVASEEALSALRHRKYLRNDRGRRAEYRWLSGQMRRRIEGYTGPSIWCAWYKLDGVVGAEPGTEHRDLLHQAAPGTPMVCLEVRIHEREVLLSDFDLWNEICCRPDFLAYDQREYAAFKSRFQLQELEGEAGDAIYRSWERIFTPATWGNFDMKRLASRTRPGHNLQAVFEELREENIVSVATFTSQRPCLRLPLLPGTPGTSAGAANARGDTRWLSTPHRERGPRVSAIGREDNVVRIR